MNFVTEKDLQAIGGKIYHGATQLDVALRYSGRVYQAQGGSESHRGLRRYIGPTRQSPEETTYISMISAVFSLFTLYATVRPFSSNGLRAMGIAHLADTQKP